MICESCRKAGDASKDARKLSDGNAKDLIAKSKVFHAQCIGSHCFCQHRWNALIKK
jgi:hypothetical protein